MKGNFPMAIALGQILNLVGKLDDSSGTETPRERFRQFLRENVSEVGQVRDYIEECLRSKGDQYDFALQDLINHLGTFLAFDVQFGRYRGVSNDIGFDGHWQSRTGFHLVVEVKTTGAFTIQTSILTGYIDKLISEKRIPDRERTLGLYVIGSPTPELNQLKNNIVGEKRTDQLRMVSVESLLSLAEMMGTYDVSHEDILDILRPSGPDIDPIVGLITRLVAQEKAEESTPNEPFIPPDSPIADTANYWITPVKSDQEGTAENVIQTLVEREKIYAFGDRTPGRKHVKPGDYICFYASGKGIVAHARVRSKPERKSHPKVRHPDRYPWIFHLDKVALYFEQPAVIDAKLRSSLDAFKERDPNAPWAWFVQATRRLSQRDFQILTRSQG